ncbi:MAG: phosphoribosylformylglycinamidine synthase I [Methanomassiliicoccales archaeon PtaU1.Bin124]|nr:MAG: phosphoribosylformylglycinamidine synthase I [Methanomassiliicoccales archaeon PtaU1.Bin124]
MKSEDIKVCVLRIEGTNCEEEMFQAFRQLGASPEKVHLKQLIGKCSVDMRRNLPDYDVLALPGGFSAGDYVRAGAIFAARMKSSLSKELKAFVSKEKPVIGVCNGFQILVELGLLPAMDGIMSDHPQAALYTNSSARFECTPTLLKHENKGKCIFTNGMAKGKIVMFPCAHAEGKLMFEKSKEKKMLDKMEENDQIVFRYVDPEGNYAGYPWCPNGSLSNIAGICNPAGNVMGMMPHPERVMYRYGHPDFTRTGENPNSAGDGRAIFESVVDRLVRKA